MSGNNFKIPNSLIEALKAGQVVPFVGTGVSMSIKKKKEDGTKSDESLFPSWKGFVGKLAEALRGEHNTNEAEYLEACINLKHPKYLEAMQHAQKELGARLWYQIFDKNFDKSKNEAQEDSLRLTELVWKFSNNLIITTNVDRAFQWTCPTLSELRILDVQNVEYAQLQKEQILKRPTVWHLHGHIDNKENVIFTLDQYKAFYEERNNAAKLQTLLNLLTQRTFLFIGFSLEDAYVREQLEYIHNLYKGSADSFYILLRQCEIEKANLPSYVKPIPFFDFGKPLEKLVEELARIANSNANAVKGKPQNDSDISPEPGTSPTTLSQNITQQEVPVQKETTWKKFNRWVKHSFVLKTSLVILITVILITVTFYFLWSGFKPNPTQSPSITISKASLVAPISSGKYPIPNIEFKNTGNITAVKVRVTTYTTLAIGGKIKEMKQGIVPNSSDDSVDDGVPLGVGQSLKVSTRSTEYANPMEKDETIKGKRVFFVWGEILYTDYDGKKYSTKFCGYNENLNSIDIKTCDKGNEAS